MSFFSFSEQRKLLSFFSKKSLACKSLFWYAKKQKDEVLVYKEEGRMEFGKLFAVNLEFKDLNSHHQDKTLVLNVVLIAKNHQMLQPLLYELKHRALLELAQEGWDKISVNKIFPSECSLIGEVMSLNRKIKQVILSNRIVVSYQHLILVTQENPHEATFSKEEEFAVALQALVSALRVQAKKSSVLQFEAPAKKDISKPISYDKEGVKGVKKVPYPKNQSESSSSLRSNKRLYELYLGQ